MDESKFQVGVHRRHCYQKSKSRIVRPTDKHPSQINLIGMISFRGANKLILFEENLNAKMFTDFLQDLKKELINYTENKKIE